MFTSLSAEATTQVFFGNTGRPASYSHGFSSRRSLSNFGSNAIFTPENRAYAGYRRRINKREDAITNAIQSIANKNNRCSNLSRNYTPARTKTSYTRNGITYYN